MREIELQQPATSNDAIADLRLTARFSAPKPVEENPLKGTTRQFQRTLKRRRAEFGLTQRQLAKELGVKCSHISYLEKGLRNPSISLIIRLARTLRVRPATLAIASDPRIGRVWSEVTRFP